MVGLVSVLVLAVGLALLMRFFAGLLSTGKMQPNMGHHTQESTTPESWEAMRLSVAKAMGLGSRLYGFSAAVAVVAAALTGVAAIGAVAGGVLLGLVGIPMLVGVFRATSLLVPVES